MENLQFKAMQERLRQATEDPLFKKLRDHKIIILQHLQHPTQRLLEEYYQEIRSKLQIALIYNFMQNDIDVSGIIRGKIQVLDEILQVKEVFSRYDTLQKTVEDEENRVKGAK